MRVQRVGEGVSGSGFVELPLGSGQGWRGAGGGSMTYRLDVPRGGKYRLWGRTLWKDGCTNAAFVSVNDDSRVTFGNDAVFERWHWVRGQQFPLNQGINFLRVANHSDGVAFDKWILTDDPAYYPEGLGRDITRFYDGFAGCDADNTGSWEVLSGTWRVVPHVGDAAGGANDTLGQWSADGGVVRGGFPVWRDYDIKVQLVLTGPGQAGIEFFQEDRHHYACMVDLSTSPARCQLLRVDAGTSTTLAEVEAPAVRLDGWLTLSVSRRDGMIMVEVNDAPVLRAPWPADSTGQIGLMSQDAPAVFDNVEVKFHETNT